LWTWSFGVLCYFSVPVILPLLIRRQ
jgi:hypothetical protein